MNVKSCKKYYQNSPFVNGTMAAWFGLRHINVHCKAQVNSYYEFLDTYQRSLCLGEKTLIFITSCTNYICHFLFQALQGGSSGLHFLEDTNIKRSHSPKSHALVKGGPELDSEQSLAKGHLQQWVPGVHWKVWWAGVCQEGTHEWYPSYCTLYGNSTSRQSVMFWGCIGFGRLGHLVEVILKEFQNLTF